VPRFNARLDDKDRAYLSACRARQTERERQEREARERELRAAQELARRRRSQTRFFAGAAVVILLLGAFATWTFYESAKAQKNAAMAVEALASERQKQITALETENRVLSQLLRQEYQQRFNNAKILETDQPKVEKYVQSLLQGRSHYERAVQGMSMPWYFLAIIHGLEGNFRFDVHLHNGDPLTARTVNVPASRPPEGAPPFTWEQSATDVIRMRKYDQWNDWSSAGMLVLWEQFNGMGFRRHGIDSPYIWACTDRYKSGSYVNGHFDPNAVAQYCGGVAMLKGLIEKGLVTAPK
jgi:lysozyme family protein